MRIWICMVGLILLVSCSPQKHTSVPAAPQAVKAEQESLKQLAIFREMIKHKMKESPYVFTIQIQEKKKVSRFQGEQRQEDWILKDEKGQKVLMEKKGTQVFIYHMSKKETMTPDQAGNVSPKDHLQLVYDLADQIRELPPTTIAGRKAEQLEVTLDQSKLAKKLKNRFLSPEAAAWMPAYSDKIQVVYRFAHDPETEKLLQFQMKIHVPESIEGQQGVTYDFFQ